MSTADERPAPVALGRHGLFVPAEVAGEVAVALHMYQDIVAGRVPPAACRSPRPSRALLALESAAATCAREHEAAKHRARAASAIGSALSASVLPSAVVTGSSDPATVTVEQAATRLGVTERHVRQLAQSGRILGTRGERAVWHLDPGSVAEYRTRRTRRNGEDGTARAPGPAGAGGGGIPGGIPAA